MAKKSRELETKSNEFIALLNAFEDNEMNKDDKEKIVETIGRVLVHTNITLDYLANE